MRRLLVQLRWWNEVNDNNEEKWIFECKADQGNINKFNQTCFWTLQLGFTLGWLAMVIINLISFNVGKVSL